MHASLYASRREKLRYSIMEAGLTALLVSSAANRFYLSGFELHDPQCNETAGWLLITARGEDWLFTDPRYEDAALRLWDSERLFVASGADRDKQRLWIKGLLPQGDRPLGIEARAMCVETFDYLRQLMPLQPTYNLVEGLRVLKDPFEMARIERSMAVNHEVFARVPELLVPGRSEAQVAWDIEKLFRELGASESSFKPIVAVDANAALPHAIPGETLITEHCLVLVDVGGRVEDYCSDQTRTFWVGPKPSDRFLRTRDLVQEAQQAAIAALRPGMPASDLYHVARGSFARHGVEAQFTHALGHGIGLETHEPPSLGPRTAMELKPGMVVSIEPGLYDPNWGGIRWEFIVEVGEEGARIL